MDESESGWWFGADRKWREGAPPSGWWQAKDGRWHPPSLVAKYLATPPFPSPMPPDETAELDEVTADREHQHQPRHRMIGAAATGLPRSAKVAISSLAAVFVVALGALAWPSGGGPTTDGGREPAELSQGQVDGPAPSTTTTTASPSPSAPSQATEAAEPAEEPPAAEPPATEPVVELGGPDGEASEDAEPSTTTTTTTLPGRGPSSTTTTTEPSEEDCESWTAPGRPDRPVGPGRCE